MALTPTRKLKLGSLGVTVQPYAAELGKVGVQGSNIASASTTDIGAATGQAVNVTGTTTITAFDTVAAGILRHVTFTGALLLTYNASSLILPTAADITTAAGDAAVFQSLGSGDWKCLLYQRADGTPLAGTAAAKQDSYEAIAFSDAGNTDVTQPAGSISHFVGATVSAGAGSYTRTVSLLTANADEGDEIEILFIMPASANPEVEVRNNTSGGTLLCTITGEAGGVALTFAARYDGAEWQPIRADYLE